jgi:hypothetical protein
MRHSVRGGEPKPRGTLKLFTGSLARRGQYRRHGLAEIRQIPPAALYSIIHELSIDAKSNVANGEQAALRHSPTCPPIMHERDVHHISDPTI